MSMTRRRLLEMLTYSAITAPLCSVPLVAAQGGTGSKKTIMIYLRGGADALNMIAPTRVPVLPGQAISAADIAFFMESDPANFTRLGRAQLLAEVVPGDLSGNLQFRAYNPDTNGYPASRLELDGTPQWMLHPRMTSFQSLFNQGRLAIVLGTGGQNDRSHFKAQDATERALPHNTGLGTNNGWLYDAIHQTSFAAGSTAQLDGVGLSTRLVESLRGPSSAKTAAFASIADFSLSAAAPGGGALSGDYAALLERLYGTSQTSHGSFTTARNAGDVALQSLAEMAAIRGASYSNPFSGLRGALYDAATLVKAAAGPRFIHVNSTGWDHHNAQLGDQQNRLNDLNNGIATLVAELEPGGHLEHTCIVIMTEFGRTLDVNGSQGTDHGDAGAMWVISADPGFLSPAGGGGKVINGNNFLLPTKESVNTVATPINVQGWKADANGRYYAPLHTDFRSVYADILMGFHGLASTELQYIFNSPNGAMADQVAAIVAGVSMPGAPGEDPLLKVPDLTGLPGLFPLASPG